MKECIYCKKVVDCIKENRLCLKAVLDEYWAYKGVNYMITLREDKQCPFEQLYHNLGVIFEGVPDRFDSVQEVLDWICENTNLKEALKDW